MKYYANKGNRQYILTKQEDVDLYKSKGFEIVPMYSIPIVIDEKVIDDVKVEEVKKPEEIKELKEDKLQESEVSLEKPKRGRPPKQK